MMGFQKIGCPVVHGRRQTDGRDIGQLVLQCFGPLGRRFVLKWIQIDQSDPESLKTTVQAAKSGLNTYTDRIEARIRDLEGQIQLDENGEIITLEDHAENLTREQLMQEISQLTLALLQPLTVVNASVEAALRQAVEESQRDLLDLAYGGGQRLQTLAKRIITLVGYPTINSVQKPD